jgi:manganese efflux pump family protein
LEFYKIAAIAVALAMDAFAVAIAAGVSLKQVGFRQTFRLSWHFGLFQALMPIAGWSAGLSVQPLIESYDHWVGFGLLALVGLKMIRDSFHDNDSETKGNDPTKGFTLVVLSIATSIDALAVGFSMSILKVAIWLPAAIIGLVACAFTIFGLHLGKRVVAFPSLRRYADAMGGIVLLAIGLKILHEHGELTFL